MEEQTQPTEKKKRMKISNEIFMANARQFSTVREIAESMGLNYGSTYIKINQLMKKGESFPALEKRKYTKKEMNNGERGSVGEGSDKAVDTQGQAPV